VELFHKFLRHDEPGSEIWIGDVHVGQDVAEKHSVIGSESGQNVGQNIQPNSAVLGQKDKPFCFVCKTVQRGQKRIN
jgi:hypothetical protein